MAKRNPYYHGPVSDHFDGHRFFNPGGEVTDRGLRDVVRWKMTSKTARWPAKVDVTAAVPEPHVDQLRVTMVGHATVLIQVAGLNVLTDPVWSSRASPLSFAGPKRVTPPGIAFERLPRIDAVLLSHNHYDHLDLATLARLEARDAPLIVTPLGNDAIVRRRIPLARVITGDWGSSTEMAPGVTAHIVPAQHWSSRSISDRRMALWGGFMLSTPQGLIYFAGDTGYGDGSIFRAMRAHYGAPDFAIIPIGAYAPRWFMAAQHCDAAEAVQIMIDLDARKAIGIHWGTFQLTEEPIEEPAELLAATLAARLIPPERFKAARPGDVFENESEAALAKP